MTFQESLKMAGYRPEQNGWLDPVSGQWFETDREAAAFLERGFSAAYDSNHKDEWE